MRYYVVNSEKVQEAWPDLVVQVVDLLQGRMIEESNRLHPKMVGSQRAKHQAFINGLGYAIDLLNEDAKILTEKEWEDFINATNG